MAQPTLSDSNFDLWRLITRVNHSLFLLQQREISQYHIPICQLQVLHIMQNLGSKATLSEIARQVEREIHVISRQTMRMEKDGLIRRIKDTPKSNLLRLEITEKGMEILKISEKSKSIDAIFSFLSEEDRRQIESTLIRILRQVKEYSFAQYYNESGFLAESDIESQKIAGLNGQSLSSV